MSAPSYCTEPNLFPSCIIWNENKFVSMCIKNSICERFTNPAEFHKVNAQMLEPTRRFQKAQESKHTTPKPPEPLPFPVRRFLEQFLGREPAPQEQRIDLSKLPANMLDAIPAECCGLISAGLIKKSDVLPIGELKQIMLNKKWKSMSKWLKFGIYFRQLTHAQMVEGEKRVKCEMREEKFKKYGIRNEETIKSEFFTKKMKEMNKK